MKVLKFNVFGHVYLLKRNNDEWLVYDGMAEGINPQVKDIDIPVDLAESELSAYLATFYQHRASDSYPDVYQI